jgi:hypothetical protein
LGATISGGRVFNHEQQDRWRFRWFARIAFLSVSLGYASFLFGTPALPRERSDIEKCSTDLPDGQISRRTRKPVHPLAEKYFALHLTQMYQI